jgi:hypothetical protein
MNPEFLREGEAVQDFMEPDRIVLGGLDDRTLDTLQAMYAVFPNAEILRTGNRTAEMIKYAANSLLATLISFSNEFANLCTALGVSTWSTSCGGFTWTSGSAPWGKTGRGSFRDSRPISRPGAVSGEAASPRM